MTRTITVPKAWHRRPRAPRVELPDRAPICPQAGCGRALPLLRTRRSALGAGLAVRKLEERAWRRWLEQTTSGNSAHPWIARRPGGRPQSWKRHKRARQWSREGR